MTSETEPRMDLRPSVMKGLGLVWAILFIIGEIYAQSQQDPIPHEILAHIELVIALLWYIGGCVLELRKDQKHE